MAIDAKRITDVHQSPIPGIVVEVINDSHSFTFRLNVHGHVSPWMHYEGIACVQYKGAVYFTHSAYWSGHFFPDVTEMEVLKATKLVKGVNE